MDEIHEVAHSPMPGIWNRMPNTTVSYTAAVRMVNRGEGTFTHLKTARAEYILRFHKFKVPKRPPIIKFREPL